MTALDNINLSSLLQTTAVLSWLFMAMALYPEIQAKAQIEVDKVIANERLSQTEDNESVPHVMTVMTRKEVFRWQPVVNIGACSDAAFQGRDSDANYRSVAHALRMTSIEGISFRPRQRTTRTSVLQYSTTSWDTTPSRDTPFCTSPKAAEGDTMM